MNINIYIFLINLIKDKLLFLIVIIIMVLIQFKEVFGNKKKYYDLNSEWNYQELINNIYLKIENDFNIEKNNLELIEVRHLQILNNLNELENNFMEILGNNKLSDLYGEKLEYLSFYIRNKNIDYETKLEKCVFCNSHFNLDYFYLCNHIYCKKCFINGENRENNELELNCCFLCKKPKSSRKL